ncbi:MAG: hypothetical protein ACI30R_07415 [Sodaliphilus sp.]
MAYRDEHICEFFNSRGLMIAMGIVYVAVSLMAYHAAMAEQNATGVLFQEGDMWMAHPLWSYGINTLCVLAIVPLVVLLNKSYTFIREVTHVYGTLFLALQLAFPCLCVKWNPGSALCLLIVIVQLIMFSTYQRKEVSQKRVFLAFFLISACSLYHYAFLALALPLLIGFFQMRAMNFRSILAMLFGLITPFWLMICVFVLNPDLFTQPDLGLGLQMAPAEQLPLLIGIGVVALLTLVLSVLNLTKIISYRLQLRVYNSFYLILALFCVVMMAIDHHNLPVYLPMLNYSLSIQIAQAFTIHTAMSRRWILLTVLLALCAGSHAVYLYV